ncbi:hypothetical protein [Ligilactobacillus animalis]|nr:hypothetical protein [Ligilactobacillus animalis]
MTIADYAIISDLTTSLISYFVLTCALVSAYVNLTGVPAGTVVV